MTREAGSEAGEAPGSGTLESTVTHEAAIAHEAATAHRSRLAWREEQLRVWDLLQLFTPWLLLTISTVIYFSRALPASGERFWPEGAAVLGLVAVAVPWVLFGQTLPIRRRTFRPVPAAVYFVGLLALCVALMTYSGVFLVFTVAGFFQAYLLRPWPVGVLGVLATSLALNGSAMRVWADPSPGTLAEFLLIVAVQTAAIGVGILLTARSEPEERKRERLVGRLEAALHENAGLHAQLVAQARESGAQDERQRLAGEIHDTLAQGLAGIITQLQAAERSAGVRGERDEHVARALRLARSSLTEARRSVRALAPQELGRAHLPDALRTLAERWSKDEGTAARVEVTGVREPLSPAIEVALFRVVQESLTNVAKHAEASRVGVTLSYAGTEVLLDVRDDGRGFAGEGGTGFGLTSMRQRIRGVGGHVEVQSTPGEGTSVSARVPAIAPGATGAEPGRTGAEGEEADR
ncbi:sensor histidine kinase [Streptomyces sp. CMC78]|uniref:Oxygen sensor histidine kinase NreB n=1 Tax=Streptomyces sp. CMC78 TaxID=3231512 RepID=A0AB33KJX3_9ACTN